MKQKVIFALVLVATMYSKTTFGQRYGIKGGLSLAKMTFKDDDDTYNEGVSMLPAFHLGFVTEFELISNIYFEPALLYSMKGYVSDEEYTGGDYHYDVRVNYLEVPLNFKFAKEMSFGRLYGALGPYLAVAASGKIRTKDTFEGTTTEDDFIIEFGSNEEEDDLKRFDAGLNIGVGAEFGAFQIGASYGLGLTNISPYSDNGYMMNNKVFYLSFAMFLNN